MANSLNLQSKRIRVFFALFLTASGSQAQTIINVMVNQPKKLEIVGTVLFSQTANSTILGDKLSIEGGVLPYQYSWAKDGQIIGSSLVLEVSKSTPTNALALTVKDAKNCSCTRNTYVTNIDGLNEQATNITVYPNPASDFIIINPQKTDEMLDVSFFDTKGILLLKKQITGKSFIDIKLPSGFYFLQIEDKDKKIVGLKKLIVS